PPVPEKPLDVEARDRSERPAPPPVIPCGPQTHPSTGTLAGRGPFIGSDLPLAIEDYALIGDCTSAALVGRNGSIDWLCWPRFDSSACFTALLGTSDHGRWRIHPADPAPHVSRAYCDGTMVLETVFSTKEGRGAVIAFMPPGQGNSSVAGWVGGRAGKVTVRLHLKLRFDYGSSVPGSPGSKTIPASVLLLDLIGCCCEHATICSQGFNQSLNAFTQSFGSSELDASLLRLPIVGFLPADDPRVRGTVAAIERELVSDGFVLRYRS